MTEPVVKVSVTPTCDHFPLGENFHGSGPMFTGTHLIVSYNGVAIDGAWVIQRDRRMKTNRERGHDWLCEGQPYTGFYVSVETRKEVTP